MDYEAFYKLTCGVYIVASRLNDKLNGQIVNTAIQVNSKPILISVSINKENLTWECINCCRAFSISVLEEATPLQFIGKFGFKSGREIDKLAGINYKLSELTQSPIVLDYTIAYFDCKLWDCLELPTHSLFIGEVVDAKLLKPEGIPLTYEDYHLIKKGKTPARAASFIPIIETKASSPKQEEKQMKKYRCTVCGYIYDPEKGDPDGGIAPGIAFEDLPEDWVCPVCGVSKDQFEPYED